MDRPDEGVPDPTREQLAAWLAGDAEAARAVFGRHRDELLARARSHKLMRRLRHLVTAEDMVDEVFLRALSSGLLQSFDDGRKGKLMAALNTVLDRTLTDAVRRHLGTDKRGRGVQVVSLDETALRGATRPFRAADPTPTSRVRTTELLDRCRAALPPREWDVWRRLHVDGKDYATIAAELELTEAAVRGLVFRARERIVTLLGDGTGGRGA